MRTYNKIISTVLWTAIAIMAYIAIFQLFCRTNPQTLQAFNDKRLNVAYEYCFKMKGFVLSHVTLILAYIFKLNEVWTQTIK